MKGSHFSLTRSFNQRFRRREMHIVEDVRLVALQGKALLLETMRLIALTFELLMYAVLIFIKKMNENLAVICPSQPISQSFT